MNPPQTPTHEKKTILALALAAGLTTFAGNAKAAVIWDNSDSFFLNYEAVAPYNLTYGPIGYTDIFGVQNYGGRNNPPLRTRLASSLVDGGNFHHGALSVIANHGDIIGPSTSGMSPYTWLSNGTNYLGISFSQSGNSGPVYYGWMEIITTGLGTFDPNPTFQVVQTAYDNTGAPIAIPEPSTYALFGLGALGMLIALRRKKTA